MCLVMSKVRYHSGVLGDTRVHCITHSLICVIYFPLKSIHGHNSISLLSVVILSPLVQPSAPQSPRDILPSLGDLEIVFSAIVNGTTKELCHCCPVPQYSMPRDQCVLSVSSPLTAMAYLSFSHLTRCSLGPLCWPPCMASHCLPSLGTEACGSSSGFQLP